MPFYSTSSPNRGLTMFPPVIKWLLLINAAIFVIGLIPAEYGNLRSNVWRHLIDYGALWPFERPEFGVWQYFTYMFFHGDFSHLFFNLLTLWMFGVELAQMWGNRRFLAFYFLCGVGAGIIHSIVTLFLGQGAPTLGASGAIMGVMLAYGLTFPDRIILVGFFLPLRAKIAVLVFIGIDLYMGVTGSPDGVAHFAHLGGALIGYILVKIGGNLTLGGIFDKIPGFGNRESLGFMKGASFSKSRFRETVRDAKYRDVEASSGRDRGPFVDLSDDRLNQVLDKMLRKGYRYQDLTEEERAILDNASEKMRRGPGA